MIEFPATVENIEPYDEELNSYTIRGINGIPISFLDQCGRHEIGDKVRVETVTR